MGSRIRKVLFIMAFSLVFVALSPAESYVIANLLLGKGWNSKILFGNAGDAEISAELRYFSSAGSAAADPGAALASNPLVIGPHQLRVLDFDPDRKIKDLQTLWALVVSSGRVQVFSLLDFVPTTPTTTPATVPSTTVATAVGPAYGLPAARSFYFAVSILGARKYNAGFAIASPNPDAVSINLRLLTKDGEELAVKAIQLAPYGQISGWLNETAFFADKLDQNTLFEGSLAVCADAPIGLSSLGAEGNFVFTVPVSNDYGCPGQ